MTRRISVKFRPVLAGYVSVSLIRLSGPMTNTERTVEVSEALGWIIPYSVETVRSTSAIIG